MKQCHQLLEKNYLRKPYKMFIYVTGCVKKMNNGWYVIIKSFKPSNINIGISLKHPHAYKYQFLRLNWLSFLSGLTLQQHFDWPSNWVFCSFQHFYSHWCFNFIHTYTSFSTSTVSVFQLFQTFQQQNITVNISVKI